MPFGLKNIGATYQHAMVYMFHNYIHKFIEFYVDDILENSKQDKDHIQ